MNFLKHFILSSLLIMGSTEICWAADVCDNTFNACIAKCMDNSTYKSDFCEGRCADDQAECNGKIASATPA